MERVRTGFTTIFNELQKEYYDNDFFSGFMEWEDLASISETFTLLNLLQKIPVYWYKINYLAAIYREKEMDDEGRVLFQKWEDEYFRRDVLDYIENVCAKQQKREENSDYEKFLSLIFGIMEEEFQEKIAGIAERAVGDACTGSNPRAIDPAAMEKLFTCAYYGTEVDF